MAERKVLNKYIPPTINPNSRISLDSARKPGQKKVRLMAPFSMQCATCGEFIYKGKKFNARKEDAVGEDYLGWRIAFDFIDRVGIQIFRFYIRCPLCASEITFKTDPKNTDYVAEHGAQRNFEPWREETRAHEAVKMERKELEQNNALLALENRTLDSKREMDILDALDEMLTKNAQMEKVDTDAVLQKIHDRSEVIEPTEAERLQEEEDERIAKSFFTDADGEKVKRIRDDDYSSNIPPSSSLAISSNTTQNIKSSKIAEKKKSVPSSSSLGIKRKSPPEDSTNDGSSSSKVPKTAVKKPLIDVDYGSSSEND